MTKDLQYMQLKKTEAIIEYAPLWIKSLHEIGINNATKNDANSAIELLFSNNAKVLRILLQGEIIGYIDFFVKYEFGSNSCYLEFIYIFPKYRRRGYASMVMNYMQDYCISKNVEHIRLWTLADNKKSIEFYKKLGFSKRNIEFGKNLSNINN